MTEVEALIEVAKALKDIALAISGMGGGLIFLGWLFLIFKNMGCHKD